MLLFFIYYLFIFTNPLYYTTQVFQSTFTVIHFTLLLQQGERRLGDISVLSSVMRDIRTDDRPRAFLDISTPATCRAVITDPGTPHRLQLGSGDSCLCFCSNLTGDGSDTTTVR